MIRDDYNYYFMFKIQQDNGVGDLQDEVIVPESSRSSLFGTIKTQAQTKLYK